MAVNPEIPELAVPLATCPKCGDSVTTCTEYEEQESTKYLRESPSLTTLWNLTLECGNCGHERSGFYAQAEVDAYGKWLDDCGYAIHQAWYALWKENWLHDIKQFSAALQADALLPEDF